MGLKRITEVTGAIMLITFAVSCSVRLKSTGVAGDGGGSSNFKASSLSCTGLSSQSTWGLPVSTNGLPTLKSGPSEIYDNGNFNEPSSIKQYVVSSQSDECLRLSELNYSWSSGGAQPRIRIRFIDPSSGVYVALEPEQSFFIGGGEIKIIEFDFTSCDSCWIGNASVVLVTEEEHPVALSGTAFNVNASSKAGPELYTVNFDFTIPPSLETDFASYGFYGYDGATSIPGLLEAYPTCKINQSLIKEISALTFSTEIHVVCNENSGAKNFFKDLNRVAVLSDKLGDSFAGSKVQRYVIQAQGVTNMLAAN